MAVAVAVAAAAVGVACRQCATAAAARRSRAVWNGAGVGVGVWGGLGVQAPSAAAAGMAHRLAALRCGRGGARECAARPRRGARARARRWCCAAAACGDWEILKAAAPGDVLRARKLEGGDAVWLEVRAGGALRAEGWELEVQGGEGTGGVVLRRVGRIAYPPGLCDFTALGAPDPRVVAAAAEASPLRLADGSLRTTRASAASLLLAAAAPAERNLWCQGDAVEPRGDVRGKGAAAVAERALHALLKDIAASDGEHAAADAAVITHAPEESGTGAGGTLGALQPAGELSALLAGARGLAMLQVSLSSQPGASWLDMPLVLTLLERAAADGGVRAMSSALRAPGGGGLLGGTLLLYADTEPYAARARLLSSFGAQSALVGGSAYYKALVGLALGYDPGSVRTYCERMGDPLSDEAERQAIADLKGASGVKV